MSSKILVTGVAGFIGSNLAVRLIEAGHHVVGVDNLSYGLAEQIPAEVEFHRCDVRDPSLADLFRGVDAVFHLAAKNCIADCQQDPVETASINVVGTVQVFEAAARAGVKKVIYAESSALYEGTQTLPTPESELTPESFYALSKMAGYHFAEGYRRHRGLIITALRYFCVYGPRQDYRRSIPPLMSAFMLKLWNGQKPIIYGNGTKRRDFVYVDDVNDFHLQCLLDPRTDNQNFNLGSGVSYSVSEILEKVKLLLEKTGPLEIDYRADQPGEAFETLADISAAKALGWEPKTSLESGLQEMWTSLRKLL
jgi:nucleoside-diphosphate-sugar epimerase